MTIATFLLSLLGAMVFFMLTGELMNAGGLSRRIVAVSGNYIPSQNVATTSTDMKMGPRVFCTRCFSVPR